jgi:hypothetical protein
MNKPKSIPFTIDDHEDLRKIACCLEMLKDICSSPDPCGDAPLEAFTDLLDKRTWDFYWSLDNRMKGGAL